MDRGGTGTVGPGRAASLAGALLDGRYEVGPVLARGGMSTVFRGTDTRLDRPVAVKVMDPRFAADPVFVQRFVREARAAAGLRHPGVVAVHDQGVDPRTGAVFLVMELVDGGTLRDLLRERGELPVPLALSVLEPVLSALAAAHRAGLVHRDVKPENVLIGPGGTVQVADFGLVRAVAEASTSTGDVILGTVAYLSPEQVATGAADPRSDVYAAGVVLYELLTGAPPFTGGSALSVAYQHVNSDVPAPGAVVPVPPAVDRLVLRATRRDPDDRPADAGALLDELQRVRADLGVPRVPVPVPGPDGAAGTVPLAGPVRRDAAPPGRTATRALARDEPPPGPPVPPPGSRAGAAPRRRRRRGAVWLALVLVVAALVGAGAWWLGSGRWTAVPPLAGLDRAAVAGPLGDAGLEAAFTEDHSDTVPPGAVLRTDPGPGGRALRGSAVEVVLSLGPPVVPDVAPGTSTAEAERQLADADLTAQRGAEEFSDTVAAGDVVAVRPAPGTVLAVGAPVTLVVSKGAGPTTVPQLRAVAEAGAAEVLAGAGLVVGEVTREYDDELPGGQVVRTEPAAGEDTLRGTRVDLVVSSSVVVPDVVGRPREEALAALGDAGVEAEETGEGAGREGARVAGLDPGPGSLLDPGDATVEVEMTTAVVVPNVTGLTVAEARERLAEVGLEADPQQLFGDDSSTVQFQSPSPGSDARPGSSVGLITF